MKTFALISFFVLSFFVASFTSSAQSGNETSNAQIYKDAIGVRLGPSTPAIQSGITYKHFMNEGTALEGILSFGNGSTGICGLYELHKPLQVENLQWFIGGGGYVAFGNNNTYFGGAGIIGLDYKFSQLPLNLSLDWKPELNIVPRVYFEGAGVGFSARFTF